MENVCLGYQEERNLYAVGSRSHTTILDARSLQQIQNKNIASLYPTCGSLLKIFLIILKWRIVNYILLKL